MTSSSLCRVAVIVLLLLTAAAGASGGEFYTPDTGSKERKAIMDALRVPCERDLGQPVIFVVSLLKANDEWAAARVQPRKPGGGEIDYSRTKYRKAQEEGMFDPTGEALLRRKDGAGPWKLVEWKFGGTDTALSAWIKSHGAPAELSEPD